MQKKNWRTRQVCLPVHLDEIVTAETSRQLTTYSHLIKVAVADYLASRGLIPPRR